MALSYVSRASDGVTTQYDLTFGYLKRSHVFVFVDGELRGFKWVSPTRIQLSSVPDQDQVIVLKRITDRVNRVTDFSDGQTLLAGDLNAGDLQSFYILQEMLDEVTDAVAAGDLAILNPGEGYITAQWIAEQLETNVAASPALSELLNRIIAEETIRAQAILDERSARLQALSDEAVARAQEIAAEASARSSALIAEAQARAADVLSLTQADLEAGQRLDTLESEVNSPTVGIKAKIATLETATTDLENNKAEASVVTAMQSDINDPVTGLKARATSLESRATAVENGKASAEDLDALEAVVNNPTTGLNSRASQASLTALSATVDGKASASEVSALQTAVNDPVTGLSTKASQVALSNLQTEVNGKASAESFNALSVSASRTADVADAALWDDVAYSWSWADGDTEGWGLSNSTLSVDADGGLVVTQVGTNRDVVIRSPTISFDGSRFTKVVADVEVVSLGTDPIVDFSLYYQTLGHGESASYRDHPRDGTPFQAVGERRLLIYDMDAQSAGGSDWVDNTITRVRLDLPSGYGSVFKVHSFRIVSPTSGRALSRIADAESTIASHGETLVDLENNKASTSQLNTQVSRIDDAEADIITLSTTVAANNGARVAAEEVLSASISTVRKSTVGTYTALPSAETWTSFYGQGLPEGAPNVTMDGAATYSLGNHSDVSPKALFPARQGLVYRVTADIEVSGSDGTANPRIVCNSLKADASYTDASPWQNFENPTLGDGRHIISGVYAYSSADYPGAKAWADPSQAVFLRFTASSLGGGASTVTRVHSMVIEEISGEAALAERVTTAEADIVSVQQGIVDANQARVDDFSQISVLATTNAAGIQDLNTAVATEAASRSTAISNVYAQMNAAPPAGANMLVNPSFSDITENRSYGASLSATGSRPNMVQNPNCPLGIDGAYAVSPPDPFAIYFLKGGQSSSSLSLNYMPVGISGFCFRQNGSGTTGYMEFVTAIHPCSPGDRVAGAVYSGAHRCTGSIFLFFYDVNGAFLSTGTSNVGDYTNVTEKLGGKAVSDFKRLVRVSTAPANAAYVALGVRKDATRAGSADSFLFGFGPQLAIVHPDATGLPPYNDFGNISAKTSALVSEVKTAITDSTGSYAYYGLKVNADGTVAAVEALADSKSQVSKLKLTADKIEMQGDVITTGTLQRGALANGEISAIGAEGTAANFYSQEADPGSKPNGSWWFKPSTKELNIRVGGAWSKVGDVTPPELLNPPWTVSMSYSGSGSAAPGVNASVTLSVTSANQASGGLQYYWTLNQVYSGVTANNNGTLSSITYTKNITSGLNMIVQGTCRVTEVATGDTKFVPFFIAFTDVNNP